MINGNFYKAKCAENNYSAQLQRCIEKACEYCMNSLKPVNSQNSSVKPIMMLGKIQSGKTRAFTGLIALAFDNCFDMVIVLTKNSSALVKQTYKRMRSEFKDAIKENDVNVFDIMSVFDDRLTDYELDKKLIVVAKKETNNLEKISKFISDYKISSRKFCLIIDDEADTTSIGFTKTKGTDNEFDLRAVASKVNSIRGNLQGYVFVQVTATPYALYLQPGFNENEIECVRPELTVLVPSGENYIGGEYYFIESKKEDSPARYIFEEVAPDELEIVTLKRGDRRRFKEEEILVREDKLTMFKKGLMNFIVGGCILRMNNPNAHYSYVIHTNTQKSSHIRLENITEIFRTQLKGRNEKDLHIIETLLSESYKDIEKSIVAFGRIMPSYEDVRAAFYNAIDRDFISVTIVNSDKDVNSILDEENGELHLRTPLSIFVGGQVLDRGVTISKIIGFYYGRNPKVMQQDTVMQHSRMFGYRDEDLLSVTRFYTTRNIYESLTKITEIDIALREDIENDRFEAGVYFIKEDERGKIVPCSPEKIRMSNIVMLNGGRRIFPIGFTPIAKTPAAKIAKDINKLLLKIAKEDEKEPILVSSHKLEEIIRFAYSAFSADEASARFVDLENFISVFRYLTRDEQNSYLIVRRRRKLSKFKENGVAYSDAPDTPQDELKFARKVSQKYPVLMMIHQDGTAEGWKGSEFWWPILLTQENVPKTIFALDAPDGRIIRT